VLHAEGESRTSISLKTEYTVSWISRIVSFYSKNGLAAIISNNYKGNHRNLSFEEEASILSPFLEKAKLGQLVDISEIKLVYEQALGRDINSKGHIYKVLARHGWRKIMPRSAHPNKASDELIASSKKKLQNMVSEEISKAEHGSVRLMFQDEAGFGRINKPKYCWCVKGVRPVVPSQHIREYQYAYGAVEPLRGSSFFLVLPYANKECMNLFLTELSKEYPNDVILLVCDKASWHTSILQEIPLNIKMFFLPPATPEMNPIEQIWKEIRKSFKNEVFKTLDKVLDRLCDAISKLSETTIMSITGREWILDCF
jgi:putative transposase